MSSTATRTLLPTGKSSFPSSTWSSGGGGNGGGGDSRAASCSTKLFKCVGAEAFKAFLNLTKKLLEPPLQSCLNLPVNILCLTPFFTFESRLSVSDLPASIISLAAPFLPAAGTIDSSNCCLEKLSPIFLQADRTLGKTSFKAVLIFSRFWAFLSALSRPEPCLVNLGSMSTLLSQ